MTVDTGCEAKMIRYDVDVRFYLKIMDNLTQEAVQADGNSPLGVKGETYFEYARGVRTLSCSKSS